MAFTIKNYRWIVVSLLFIGTTINYLDRQIIGLLKPILEQQFDWSESDFARIAMAFSTTYAIGLLGTGWFIDKVGTKRGYSFAVILWSIAGMLHAMAKNVLGFSLARLGLGLGEAGNFPAAMKAVAEWFPVKERGIATGIFNSGTSVGAITAIVVTPIIFVNYGWQAVFWITGATGFVWLLLWLWLYETPLNQKYLSDDERKYILRGQEINVIKGNTSNPPWIKLFSLPQTWAYITGKFFIDPIFWFFLLWLPSYFSSTFNLDLTRPSLELMIIYTSTTLGSFMGGYISSALINKGMPALKARKTAMLIFALLELSIITSQFITNMWLAVAVISLAVAVHQAWATNVFTAASDMFDKSTVSSVVGIGGMAGAIGGILFPLLVGYILDCYKLLGNISIGYHLIFTLCGVTYLFAWIIIHLLTRKLSVEK
jgi:ACS family hexuronate transporter-like MFS transporter